MGDPYLSELDAAIARLNSDRARIDAELSGLERARELYIRHLPPASTHGTRAVSQARRSATSLRSLATDILREHPAGLTSGRAFDIAVARNPDVKKPSLVSALSVGARAGDFVRDGDVYKLPSTGAEPAPAAREDEEEAGDDDDDRPAPTSGVAPFVARRIANAAP
jgi:hypothetical protein